MFVLQDDYSQNNQQRRVLRRHAFFIIVGMIFWDAVGIIYSDNKDKGTRLVLQEMEYPLTYFVVTNCVRSIKDTKHAIAALYCALILCILLTFWQWYNVFFLTQLDFQWPLWDYTNLAERASLMGVVSKRGELEDVDAASSVMGDRINFSNFCGVGILFRSYLFF